jgi:outer membrane protein TolC
MHLSRFRLNCISPNDVRRILFSFLHCALWLPPSPLAAETLTLPEAVAQALARHPSIEAAKAQTGVAVARTAQARSGYLPKVNYAESFQSSNNPVFAFSTLLTQRRFSAANFAIDALNHPGFVNNFQSSVSVDQVLYDFGGVRAGVNSAQLGEKLSAEQERFARMQLIAKVARTYHTVTLAEQFVKAAQQAVQSAAADLARAEAVRAAGLSTDADVLSIRVHLAAMREQQIQRQSGVEIARAALNEALGQPLDTVVALATPLTAAAAAPAVNSAGERPELRQAALARELAESQATGARSALYPQLTGRAAWEANRGRFVNQGGANWYFGVGVRWNLFNGFADRARLEESAQTVAKSKANERETLAGVNLELRQAQASLTAAQQRIEVATATVAQAEESLRITKNRYEAGLTTVTDLLRTETALLDATTRRIAAIYDHRLAAVAVQLAAGTLSGDSNVLQ